MRPLLLFLLIIPLLVNDVHSQPANKVFFDSVETLTEFREYDKILSYAESRPITNKFTGDSLAWVQLRISRAHLNVGNYTASNRIVKNAYQDVGQFSNELQNRTYLLYGLTLKKLGHYKKAIQQFESAINKISTVNYELLATATINYANTHWELGNYQKYGQYTARALRMAKENDDRRRIILTRRNITEYYEITELAQKKQNTQLDTLATLVDQSGSKRDVARYKIREANYQREKLDNYSKAITLLSDARRLSQSVDNFQTWEQASYQLVHTYFKNDDLAKAEDLLNDMSDDSRIQDILWASQKHRARLVQCYLLRGKKKKAEPIVSEIKKQQPTVNNIEAQVLGLHAQIMYKIHTNNMVEARQKIIKQLKIVTDNAHNIDEKEGLSGNILYLYSKAKYSTDNFSEADIRQKVIDQYMQQKINDWVYDRSQSQWILKILIILFIGIGGIWGINKWKSFRNSHYEYMQLRHSIESR